MHRKKQFSYLSLTSTLFASFLFIASSAGAAAAPAEPAAAPKAAAQAKPAEPAAQGVIRIKAGVTAPLKDETGVMWLAEQGFIEGETTDRPDLKIENTKTPSLYLSEHYSMTKFTQKLPNGKYVVKLHFAETYEGIEGPGQRVFTFKVGSQEFKNFDIWVKTGGPRRAYIETVPVTITDGHLDITFTPQVENPEINAIEIIPAP